MGQTIIIKVPHAIVTLLMGPGARWLSTSQMLHYQGDFYTKIPNLRVEPCQALNPATYLLVSQGTPSHSCEEMLEEVFSSRPDLRDIPLSQPDETYYTDRTAYLEQGSLAPHERLPEILVLPREKTPTGAAARGNP